MFAAIIDQPERSIEDFYRLLEALGGDPIEGQFMHAVGSTRSGLRHIEVWETSAHGDRFRDQRLLPAMLKVYKTDLMIAEVSVLDLQYFSARQPEHPL